VAIHDLGKTNFRNMNKIFALLDFAKQNDCEFKFLFDLNATPESIEKFKQKVGRSDFNIYFSDDKSIKAIVRSNPGLILLHDGVVLNKWAWAAIPSVENIQKIIKN
jgi:triosephosphate isomerase